MTRNLVFTFLALWGMCASVVAQKPKVAVKKPSSSSGSQSNADKMGYARTNKYWGPGTYYCFAPGAVRMKTVNTSESAMRDLTGISREDCLAEITKQGFTAVPPKQMEKWFNPNKSKGEFFYSPDKSYVLSPNFHDMYMSQEKDFMPYGTCGITRTILLPRQDSLKVIEMAWQYMRDLNEMKVLLSSFGSDFKKADPKAYPIERAGSSGWNSMRAGTFVLKVVDGKPHGYWDQNENIIRRTIGNSEFEMKILACETDFWYGLTVKLQKEGYVLVYEVVASTMKTLPPGATWVAEHKKLVEAFTGGERMDKEAVNLYKKAPLPPVMADLNKLLNIN